MKKLFVFTFVVMLSSVIMAQEDGTFGISVGGCYLMADNLIMADLPSDERTNGNGFEFGIVTKVPVAEQGLVKTMVTGITYIKLPWDAIKDDPPRSDHVISTFVGVMGGNPTGIHVFGGPTVNFGLFNQGYLGIDIGAGYGMNLGVIDKIVDFSIRYSVFNALNKLKDDPKFELFGQDSEISALDLIRFNVTLSI